MASFDAQAAIVSLESVREGLTKEEEEEERNKTEQSIDSFTTKLLDHGTTRLFSCEDGYRHVENANIWFPTIDTVVTNDSDDDDDDDHHHNRMPATVRQTIHNSRNMVYTHMARRPFLISFRRRLFILSLSSPPSPLVNPRGS